MPIIINEIEIAVEVAPGNNTQSNTSTTADALQREEIIKECVEKVMEIINQKNER
ncbi:DUF5908 family protein [Ilyomonas limi]|uniref:DUF5908 family protein n=1 Tax=Ilyomonas limi TaxID=2575867 RepID=UPI001484E6CE|nr:DUF5908 family protein [Ilyomonas limi]